MSAGPPPLSLFPSAFHSRSGVTHVLGRTTSLLKFHDLVIKYVKEIVAAEATCASGMGSLRVVPVPDELDASRMANAWSVFERAMGMGAAASLELWSSLGTTLELMEATAKDQRSRLNARRVQMIKVARDVRTRAAKPRAMDTVVESFLVGAQVVHHDAIARLGSLLSLLHEHYRSDDSVWKTMYDHLRSVSPSTAIHNFVNAHATEREEPLLLAQTPILTDDDAIDLLNHYKSRKHRGMMSSSMTKLEYTAVPESAVSPILPTKQLPDDDRGSGSSGTAASPAGAVPEMSEAYPAVKKDEFADLPPGWTAHYDPQYGQHYFYNAHRDEVTWDRPTTHAANAPPAQPAVHVVIHPDGTRHKVKRRKTRIRKKRPKSRSPGPNGEDDDDHGYDSSDEFVDDEEANITASADDMAWASVWGTKPKLDDNDISELIYG